MSQAQTLEELAERAQALIDTVNRVPALDVARGMLIDAQLPKARQHLRASLLMLAEKQRELRVALEEERDAKKALDRSINDAEWELLVCFEVRANKTWLIKGPDGVPIPEAEQRSMTVDEKKAWIARQVEDFEAVGAFAARLAKAEHDVAGYRDALDIADKSLKAARSDLDAAIAHLGALVTALPARTQGEAR